MPFCFGKRPCAAHAARVAGIVIKKRPILGTFVAFTVSVAATLVTVPTIAIETTVVEEVPVSVEQSVRHSTEDIVRAYFADVPVMAEIAFCESTFRHIDPATGTVLRGWMNNNDLGVMQINESYHGADAVKLGLDLHTLEDNLAYARHLYDTQGTQPWSASKPCWNRRAIAMR
jgi:hypothetical protein